MHKSIICAAICLMLAPAAMAQQSKAKPKGKTPKWSSWASKCKDKFFTTDEALRVGDQVLLYQHNTGGWPKNVNMQVPLTDEQREELLALKNDSNNSTIDNKATTTEIIFLARLYNATGQERYLQAVERGFNYLFRAQYDNGGWPQFYPRPKGYYTHITYNDDAMINVLKVMRDASKGKEPFECLPEAMRQRAKEALDRGVDCILKTQVVRDGKPTVWCAQHDEHTLEPAKARAYELISFSGAESAGITLFLMSLSKPSMEVRQCVENAVQWFRDTQIDGLTYENYTDSLGRKDYRMVPCKAGDDCTPLWARFYDIDTNEPFFTDRDGIKRHTLEEIGHERRVGYGWYNSFGLDVYERYEAWKEKYGTKE